MKSQSVLWRTLRLKAERQNSSTIMLRNIDNYFLNLPEPNRSCMQALRDYILALHPEITEAWKYRLPFFLYKGKMFCYFWADKKTGLPYIGIVEGININHPMLEQGNRKRMKILRISPEADLPIEVIEEVLTEAMKFYKKTSINSLLSKNK